MKRKLDILSAILLSVVLMSPASAQVKSAGTSVGIDVSGMDRSARPQDDFVRFVNGAWVDKTQIPADMSSYSSIVILRDKSQTALRGIIEEAAAQKTAPRGSNVQKVGDLYRSFMDTSRIEELGLKLELQNAPIETIVLVSVQRPSEN